MKTDSTATPHRTISYDAALSLREAREIYFARYGFDNGGYDDRWVTLRVGPVPVVIFPNIQARVVAVKYHDLHHIVTGYPATWVGESEIGAWEVSTGCGRHWPAWILNLDAFAIGLAIAPRMTYRAFMRGRVTENLYAFPFTDELLARSVGSVRRQLRLDIPVTGGDRRGVASFVAWGLAAILTASLPLMAIAAIVALLL